MAVAAGTAKARKVLVVSLLFSVRFWREVCRRDPRGGPYLRPVLDELAGFLEAALEADVQASICICYI